MGKNSLNNFICHLSWLKKLCPCSYTSPQNHSWIFKTLWVIIFWVRVTHKMLNVNWEKIHSIILSVTCHGFRNFAPAHTHPLVSIHEFSKPCKLFFFELESLIKCWMWIGKKIHSIILSVTCHGFRNFPWLIHIPSKPIMNFQNPASYYFWVRVTHKMLNVNWEKNSLNNFICHLSWLKKLCPCSYTSPQNQSWIFKTLQVIIFWVRVTHKMLNVNWEKIHSIILSVTCHGFRNFPWLIHIPPKPVMNFQNPASYYFWVRVTHKMLNVNWEKIHSIILSVTCHDLRNFAPLIHIPSKPFVNFQDPMSYYFLS